MYSFVFYRIETWVQQNLEGGTTEQRDKERAIWTKPSVESMIPSRGEYDKFYQILLKGWIRAGLRNDHWILWHEDHWWPE